MPCHMIVWFILAGYVLGTACTLICYEVNFRRRMREMQAYEDSRRFIPFPKGYTAHHIADSRGED